MLLRSVFPFACVAVATALVGCAGGAHVLPGARGVGGGATPAPAGTATPPPVVPTPTATPQSPATTAVDPTITFTPPSISYKTVTGVTVSQAGYSGAFAETGCTDGKPTATTCRMQGTVGADGAGYVCQNGTSSVVVSVPSVPIGGQPVAKTFAVRSAGTAGAAPLRVYCTISFAEATGSPPSAFGYLIVDVTI